ncbi:MAG: NUDIX domain-containing protein [Treponema sp.]|nr:NUDIX domain-containing protein [Treponema sp.]MBR5645207.1 NUDIX domain-containing protein [Treponema sp.]
MEEKVDLSDLKCGYPDCCFMAGGKWFRYRTAGLIVEDGELLLIGNKSVDYLYTIGGGVHLGEHAEDCVLREVKEETGVDYEIDHLAVICENFFIGHEEPIEDYTCHVIEFYFLMKPRGSKELHSDSYGWNNQKEEVVWIPLEKLPQTNVKPDFIKIRMPEILKGKSLIHIVNDER